MIVKYVLDEGGLIRELDDQKGIPLFYNSKLNDLNEWLDPIRKTRFKDERAMVPGPWRCEIMPDVWVISVMIYKDDKQVAAYWPHNDFLIADESVWGR